MSNFGASMIEGRLVWSCRTRGLWHANSNADQFTWYRLRRVVESPAWWRVILCTRVPGFAPIDEKTIGGRCSLREAKRLADQHHHDDISTRGGERIRNYIARYPLKELHG